jgi:hypothetical protein
VLPDRYDYGPERLRQRFHDDLCSFARQLVLTDPQDLATSAKVLQDHRRELAFVADLIAWSPVSYDDASDHNTGVSLSRALHVYRAKQSRRAKQFFRAVVRDPRVARLLDEVIALRDVRSKERGREAFDRLHEMQSLRFAAIQAGELADLTSARRAPAECPTTSIDDRRAS